MCHLIELICVIYSNQLHYLGTSLFNNNDSICEARSFTHFILASEAIVNCVVLLQITHVIIVVL